jgi:hypothetical protein
MRGTAALLAAGALTSCSILNQELEQEPWANMKAGAHSVGFSTGWAWDEAQVILDDKSGEPDLGKGSATTDLDPIAGGGLKYSYNVTDNFSVGAIAEFRTFDPDPVAPLDSVLDADEYTSYHYILTTRFFTQPFGKDDRLRFFAGLDLGWVDSIELNATVIYAPGVFERVTVQGDAFWTLAPVIGGQYQITDRLTLDFGAFYEWGIENTNDTVQLNIPIAGDVNDVDGALDIQGFFIAGGLSYYL